MDKLIYFLAGLAMGHLLNEKKKDVSAGAFVPVTPNLLQQIALMNQVASQVPQPESEPALPPEVGTENSMSFKCWLCHGITTFQYTVGPAHLHVDCSRCGIQNFVKTEEIP